MKIPRWRRLNQLLLNRLIYASLLIGTGIYTWLIGERILYIAFLVLFFMPIVSLVITYINLKELKISQRLPDKILKNEEGILTIYLQNNAIIPFHDIDAEIVGKRHVVDINEYHSSSVDARKSVILKIPFEAFFRGKYEIGLSFIKVSDITGLFRLKIKQKKLVVLHVLPQIKNITSFPIRMNLLSQAQSQFDMKDEDYSTVSDIRQYVPTDSIKRVHWKLTAKRNEWLVKVFESNALNQVVVIFDSLRLDLWEEECYALEDRMIHDAISISRFCLAKGMPVDLCATNGLTTRARSLPEFNVLYEAFSDLEFEDKTVLDCTNILTHVINESTGYVNAIIFTPLLVPSVFERIKNAVNNGHYVAVIYFESAEVNQESEKIYNLLVESGIPCFRVSDKEDEEKEKTNE